MIRALTLGLLAAVATTSAMAADLIVEPEVAEAAVAAVGNWSGVYVGVQGGYAFATGEVDDTPGVPGTSFTYPPEWDMNGAFVGIYAGANMQMDSIVVGLEGDINASWVSGAEVYPSAVELGGSVDWFGSVRGRLGFAAEDTLFFATAGWAGASGTHFQDASGDVDVTLTGWTAGLGVEQMFADNLVGRVEYRYYDLSSDLIEMPGGFTDRDYFVNAHTLSVGVGLKF